MIGIAVKVHVTHVIPDKVGYGWGGEEAPLAHNQLGHLVGRGHLSDGKKTPLVHHNFYRYVNIRVIFCGQ